MFRRRSRSAREAEVDPKAEYYRLVTPRSSFVHLERREQLLVALGDLRADVNNGGFHQYFFNSAGDNVSEALDAAVTGGSPELASLIRRALEVLAVADPSDRDARQARLVTDDDDADDALADEFDEIDREYYELEAATDLDAVMRALIR